MKRIKHVLPLLLAVLSLASCSSSSTVLTYDQMEEKASDYSLVNALAAYPTGKVEASEVTYPKSNWPDDDSEGTGSTALVTMTEETSLTEDFYATLIEGATIIPVDALLLDADDIKGMHEDIAAANTEETITEESDTVSLQYTYITEDVTYTVDSTEYTFAHAVDYQYQINDAGLITNLDFIDSYSAEDSSDRYIVRHQVLTITWNAA